MKCDLWLTIWHRSFFFPQQSHEFSNFTEMMLRALPMSQAKPSGRDSRHQTWKQNKTIVLFFTYYWYNIHVHTLLVVFLRFVLKLFRFEIFGEMWINLEFFCILRKTNLKIEFLDSFNKKGENLHWNII